MGSKKEDDRLQRVIKAFNIIAKNYDNLKFTNLCAERTMQKYNLPKEGRVLDLATGTGLVAALASNLCSKSVKIIGIDVSVKMLEIAKSKTKECQNPPEFIEGNAEHLDFEDNYFDAIFCISSLFFMQNTEKSVREVHRVLKPGGYFVFTSFGKEFLQPLNNLLRKRMKQYEVILPEMPQLRLSEPEKCNKLLINCGFRNVKTDLEDLSYYHSSPEERWLEIESGLENIPLLKVSLEIKELIKTDHIKELDKFMTEKGIKINMPVIFAYGEK